MGGTPQVADAILGNEMFSYYDKAHIGRLCEQVRRGLIVELIARVVSVVYVVYRSCSL